MTRQPMPDQIMEQINTGHITMRPRWHFFALSALSGAIFATLAAITAYLVQIMTLTIRIQVINRPMYGARAHLSDLLASFPWWAVICAVMALGLAVWLMRRSTRLYRWPVGWVVVVVSAIAIAAGIGWSFLPISGNHQYNGQHPRGSYQQQK